MAREPVALDEPVGDVALAPAPLAEGRNPRLAAGAVAPSVVPVDQTRLMQLLVHRIDNASEDTPPGGAVAVRLRRQDGLALPTVADTGAGSAAEHRPQPSERCYRVDAARSRAGGGAGRGPAIARWIAQAHGGLIDVASTVRLPLARAGGAA